MSLKQEDELAGKTVGERLKYFRLKLGMSQGMLGKGICTTSAISQIEIGGINPTPKLLAALADRMGISIYQLRPESEVDDSKTLTLDVCRVHLERREFDLAAKIVEGIDLEEVALYDLVTVAGANAMCYAFVTKEYDAAIEIMRRALDRPTSDDMTRAGLYLYLGHSYRAMNDWTGAYASYNTALDWIARVTTTGRLFAEISYHQGVSSSMIGRYTEAKAHLLASYQYFSRGEDLRKRANLLYQIGVAQSDSESLRKSLVIYEQISEEEMSLTCRKVIAFNHTAKEDYHAALIDLLQVGSQFLMIGNADLASHSFSQCAQLSQKNGDLVSSELAISKLTDLLGRAELSDPYLAESKFALSQYHLALGEVEEAKRFSVESGELFKRSGMSKDSMRAYSVAVQCCQQLGQLEEALQLALPVLREGGEI